MKHANGTSMSPRWSAFREEQRCAFLISQPMGAQPQTAAWGRCVQAVRARARAPRPTGKGGLGHPRPSKTDRGAAVLRRRSALRVNASQFDAQTAWSVAGAASAPALFQASLLP